ncbi:hypothetical protein [Sphingomonas sp. PB4P5]|uniref:hypothetical protein n=1 Tax=Parasphingomonas puruogangriensis TaxID=3096155 RepID=UPI002FC628C6
MADDDDVWFEAKRFGYGAGLPVAWQGWVLLGAYIALVIGLSFVLKPPHPVPYYAVVIVATLALMLIAARHTRGGWRWRP